MEAAAPVCRFEVGHISSGIRLSRTYAAKPSEAGHPVVADGDVVDDAYAVPEAVGAAPLEGLPDRRRAEGLAGVDGEVRVLALEVLEGVEVAGGRVARLRAGDVEADHAAVAVADHQLGDLARACLVAHRGHELAGDDRVAGVAGLGLPLGEALPDLVDDLLELHPALEVLLGGVADLGVHDTVGGQVHDALARDPAYVLRALHHRDRVVEGLQVARQRAGVAGLDEPGAEPLRGVGAVGQLVADLVGDLEDRLRAQPSVEVVVQQDLGGAGDQLRDGRDPLVPGGWAGLVG